MQVKLINIFIYNQKNGHNYLINILKYYNKPLMGIHSKIIKEEIKILIID